jgi:membrane fusion protein, copper/silver efflux system
MTATVRPSPRTRLAAAAQVALARLRFPLLLSAVLLGAGAWPTLRNWLDTLTQPPPPAAAVSTDTEYWCPMCPGVVSDWPAKCPVCKMTLIRRQKGEATPLPDGVVARMQLSPYRVQLAGLRTAPVEYRALVQEVTVAGLLADGSGRLTLQGEVFEPDVGLMAVDLEAEITCDSFPGRPCAGRVVALAPRLTPVTRGLTVRLEVENPQQELHAGQFATARLRVPLTHLGQFRQFATEEWRDRTAAALTTAALASPAGPPPGAGLETLLGAAVRQALLARDRWLAVPEGAVVDAGARQVVYVERMPGLFDGVEVRLGRRCGDYYPVLRGLESGQSVVTAGAFLLDAETRLNPALASAYFGAGARPVGAALPKPPASGDQELIARQKVCPVTNAPLGSMGEPARVVVQGRTVFLCCASCEPALRKDPKKYLAKLPPPDAPP